MRPKKAAFILAICVLAITIILAVVIVAENRAWHRAVIVQDTNTLLNLLSDWEKAGQTSSQEVTNLFAKYVPPNSKDKPYLYTKVVNVDGTNYNCVFGFQDTWFAKNERLVITSGRVVILINRNGNRIIGREKAGADGLMHWDFNGEQSK